MLNINQAIQFIMANINQTKDYIIERSTSYSGTWAITKWNSGRYEAECTVTSSALAIATAVGGVYQSSNLTFSLSDLTELLTITEGEVKCIEGSYGVWTATTSLSTSSIGYLLFSGNSRTGTARTLKCRVVGTWK